MANADDVAQVLELLPADAGWDETKIGEMLDAGNSIYKVMLRYWNKAAADSAKLVSISESGSSRDLSTIHRNAVAMAAYWDDKVKAEEAVAVAISKRGRARTYIARRV